MAAISAGAATASIPNSPIDKAYSRLKDLITKKFGDKSEVVQAMNLLEAKPESVSRKETLQEEIAMVNAEQDNEVVAETETLLKLIHFQSNLSYLHPDICTKCKRLFETGAYGEAVEKSFKVVRDQLRLLTTYETGSEAFGKGRLRVKGAAAPYVEEDFNEAVKFLTMAIDRFRNERAHSSDAKISEPQRAFEYLCMSSLAMHLLEGAEARS